MTTTASREGTGTRDWSPPVGEFRPSSLGACPRYAWEQMRIPEDERPRESIGKRVQLYAGHAAEHHYFELLNAETDQTWTLDYELDNGFGGICHPDGVDFTRRVVAEIKFTGYKEPAPYHRIQNAWYVHRMSVTTGERWRGEIHLLDKFGSDPKVFPQPVPDAEFIQKMTRLAELHMQDRPPAGVCNCREDAEDVRYYDIANEKKSRKGSEIVCPMLAKCFPPPDDGMEVW